jgi:hypothetical protein
MSNQNAVVGIYKTHTGAEGAVKELQIVILTVLVVAYIMKRR